MKEKCKLGIKDCVCLGKKVNKNNFDKVMDEQFNMGVKAVKQMDKLKLIKNPKKYIESIENKAREEALKKAKEEMKMIQIIAFHNGVEQSKKQVEKILEYQLFMQPKLLNELKAKIKEIK